jgi:sulfate transport system permease protein
MATLALRSRAETAARATREPRAVKLLLTAVAVGFVGLFLIVPLVAVFVQAFEKGWAAYAAALREPIALSALRLTLLTAGVAVPLNLVFGVAAAWAVTKFEFPGKNILISPRPAFSVSPSSQGWSSSCLFKPPGVLGQSSPHLKTSRARADPGHRLLTFPFVARGHPLRRQARH